MSTPYTLMRCRMKDLISCFNLRKLPIEKEAHESDHQNPPQSSIVNDRKLVREEKVEIKTTVENGGGEESPSSWQSCESEEDDYIVFYFKDDDGVTGGLIEERTVESSLERKQDIRLKKKIATETKEKSEAGELRVRDTLGESSDSSTSSFAFPTIQREWTGSPVLMPRPEGNNKSGGVCVQCCKF